MAELISTQNALANSADFTLTDGQTVSLALKDDGADNDIYDNAIAYIQYKSSNGKYVTIGQLDFKAPMRILSAPGTFRVSKPASAYAYGVDKV